MSTLLVGLDAACDRVLSRLLEADAIPNLERVFEDGVTGPLESQIPPRAASAWPSLYTGMNPGKHGVFGVLGFDGYDWSVVDASRVRERPIWEQLDHYGLSSVVVNVPVTHPPRPFEGALVPGYVAPGEPTCYPEGLLEDVRHEIGGYRLYPESDGAATTEAYRELVRMRGRAFRYLVDQFAPDFGFLAFQATGTFLHDRHGDPAAVRAVYESVDEQVGAVIDACEPDNVLVASDRGVEERNGYVFHANEFLRARGFAEAKRGGFGPPAGPGIEAPGFEAPGEGDSGGRPAVTRLVALLARAGLTSQRLETLLAAVGLDEPLRRRVPTSVIQAGAEQVDGAASRAFVRWGDEYGVRINLEGREPDGVVPRQEYIGVREELVSVIASATTPEGDRAFADVAPREEYFEGPAAVGAVDVVAVPADPVNSLSARLSEGVFSEPATPWRHTREGVIAAAGTDIDAEAPPGSARLFDVAPTVLATFDVPADERMDGSALPFVESCGVRSFPRVNRRERPGYGSSVERRRSDLGYLDRDT